MKMYPPKGGLPADVSPGQVETMKNRGWVKTKPKANKQTKEVKSNG